MNFSGDDGIQVSLPQFAELTSRANPVSSSEFISSQAMELQAQTAVYTTAAASQNKQQFLVNSPNKYPGSLLTWPDPNALMQLCEKQGIQAINIPTYGQNNTTLLGVQPTLPLKIIPNAYLPSTSQIETVKESENKTDMDARTSETECQVHLQQQSVAMAEYLQKLQATTLPLTLQQLIKLQTEQAKKEKSDEDKVEHTQNSILNIPSVPIFRSSQLQNGNSFLNSEHTLVAINPNDLNVHLENQQENISNTQPVKVEQQIQTDSPKMEKKMKFRAKTGEIKISVGLDGRTLYCCPECNLAFPEKLEVEQHIQAHIQERKYQCKECGAMLKRKEHLDQHMRGHSDERPFKCPVCQKAFKRNEHLTRHFVIHSGDKNFSCNVCQKAFSRKDHLNKHAQTHLGIKKNKAKKDSLGMDQKESFDKSTEGIAVPKQEVSFIVKQEASLLQHIQNLQRDQNLLHTFTSFKEQAMKEASMLQQQAVNMNDILPQNTRYLMPS